MSASFILILWIWSSIAIVLWLNSMFMPITSCAVCSSEVCPALVQRERWYYLWNLSSGNFLYSLSPLSRKKISICISSRWNSCDKLNSLLFGFFNVLSSCSSLIILPHHVSLSLKMLQLISGNNDFPWWFSIHWKMITEKTQITPVIIHIYSERLERWRVYPLFV